MLRFDIDWYGMIDEGADSFTENNTDMYADTAATDKQIWIHLSSPMVLPVGTWVFRVPFGFEKKTNPQYRQLGVGGTFTCYGRCNYATADFAKGTLKWTVQPTNTQFVDNSTLVSALLNAGQSVTSGKLREPSAHQMRLNLAGPKTIYGFKFWLDVNTSAGSFRADGRCETLNNQYVLVHTL